MGIWKRESVSEKVSEWGIWIIMELNRAEVIEMILESLFGKGNRIKEEKRINFD